MPQILPIPDLDDLRDEIWNFLRLLSFSITRYLDEILDLKLMRGWVKTVGMYFAHGIDVIGGGTPGREQTVPGWIVSLKNSYPPGTSECDFI